MAMVSVPTSVQVTPSADLIRVEDIPDPFELHPVGRLVQRARLVEGGGAARLTPLEVSPLPLCNHHVGVGCPRLQRVTNHHDGLRQGRGVLRTLDPRDDEAVARERSVRELERVGRAPHIIAGGLDGERPRLGVEHRVAREAHRADVLMLPAAGEWRHAGWRDWRHGCPWRHRDVVERRGRRLRQMRRRGGETDGDVRGHRDRVASREYPRDAVAGLISGHRVAAAIEPQLRGAPRSGPLWRTSGRS